MDRCSGPVALTVLEECCEELASAGNHAYAALFDSLRTLLIKVVKQVRRQGRGRENSGGTCERKGRGGKREVWGEGGCAFMGREEREGVFG